MAMRSAFDVVGWFLLEDAFKCVHIPQPTRVVEALAFAADVFEDEVAPTVYQAMEHSPESREAMRFVNYYYYAHRRVEVHELMAEIHDCALALREILEILEGWSDLMSIGKDLHAFWLQVRPRALGAAIEKRLGLIYFVADTLELFGHNQFAKQIRRAGSLIQPNNKAYAFHDPEYVDTVLISDSEDDGA